ncbi:Hypothetical_protein [Hexamita inflata]|uniref:Hypothetical_protein n=1 Tax=Hexamita inflata TaxID=28002 RepID=A0AA86UGW4_9EUKA|nr:Hypothetical protein HINF_LOCUS8788 [Hexamita inflata]CAI9921144.1 Hypothetical protein HINF_LOCUS8789 [Hexamita inflata]CAI9950637.1 Hypothetical protein HINF_LOCUS38282 [Hexamita inflata]
MKRIFICLVRQVENNYLWEADSTVQQNNTTHYLNCIWRFVKVLVFYRLTYFQCYFGSSRNVRFSRSIIDILLEYKMYLTEWYCVLTLWNIMAIFAPHRIRRHYSPSEDGMLRCPLYYSSLRYYVRSQTQNKKVRIP